MPAQRSIWTPSKPWNCHCKRVTDRSKKGWALLFLFLNTHNIKLALMVSYSMEHIWKNLSTTKLRTKWSLLFSRGHWACLYSAITFMFQRVRRYLLRIYNASLAYQKTPICLESMWQRAWKKPDRKHRHVIIRYIVHGFHHFVN